MTLEQLTAKMAKWGVLWNDEAELYLKLIRASHKASRPKQGHKSGVENKGVTVVQNAPKPI